MPQTDPAAPFGAAKPALHSSTILYSVGVLLSSAATVIMVVTGTLGPDALGPALVSAAGAVGAIVGRLRARAGIRGIIKAPPA